MKNSCLFITLIFLISGCAHYRVIELERFYDVSGNQEDIVTTYAATKNNMIIPELVIDRKGSYPTDRDIADDRMRIRKTVFKEKIRDKYSVENSFLFQTRRISLTVGQIIVSPIVIPVIWIYDFVHKTVPEERLLRHYIRQIVYAPIPQKPVLRNEMAVV